MKLFLLLLILSIANSTFAFSWEAHRSITKNAMIGMSISGMKEINSGNISVDKKPYKSERCAHFDSEEFTDGSNFIRRRLLEAKQRLGSCNASGARKAFGQALHPVQDFYSHSNWVEKHLNDLTTSLDLLNMKDPKSSEMQYISTSCCNDMSQASCQSVRLTSGYVGVDDLLKKYCSHNQMNKDDKSHRFHEKAKEAATFASKRILKNFIRDLIVTHGPQKAKYLVKLFNGSTKYNSLFCTDSGGEPQCGSNLLSPLDPMVTRTLTEIVNNLYDDEMPENLYPDS